MNGIEAVTATVAIAGFAIQQALELLAPGVTLGVKKLFPQNPGSTQPIPEADLKKWAMALVAFLLGLGAVLFAKISLLSFVDEKWRGSDGDILVSALVLGAGTEGLNTLTKFFGYVKEGRKKSIAAAIEVAVIPPSVTVKVGETFKFRAGVKNTGNPTVTWEVPHGAGGTIDDQGLYTAPAAAGIYQIFAVSAADSTKHGIGKVIVTS